MTFLCCIRFLWKCMVAPTVMDVYDRERFSIVHAAAGVWECPAPLARLVLKCMCIIRHELDVGLADVREELDAIEDELGAVHSDMNDLWAEISGKGSNQVKLEDVDANSNTSCVWQFRLANTNDAKLLDAYKDEHGVRVHRILSGGRRGGGGWRRVEEDAARAAEEEDANGSEHVGWAIDLVSRVLSYEDGALLYYKVVIL